MTINLYLPFLFIIIYKSQYYKFLVTNMVNGKQKEENKNKQSDKITEEKAN